MEESKDIGVDELLEWAKLNHMVMSESKAKEIIDVENAGKDIDAFEEYIDLDEWYKENGYESPIGEYESLSKKMKKKINDIVKSMEEKDEKELENETDDRDEKDTLDEKDGKEELDEDKKKEVEEREKENGEDSKEDKETGEDEKENEVDVREDKNTEAKNEEELNKAEYLARVKKLHEMRLVEYKNELKKDDVNVDKHFVNMIYLQRAVNRDRQHYVKKFGEEGIKELAELENKYVKEELKYEKTIYQRHEKDLASLRRLDEKLDRIMDKMESLQNGLEKGNISVNDYNEEIKALEKDKVETLWEINKLNPELIQQKQDRNVKRDEYERSITSKNMGKMPQNNLSKENNEKQKELEMGEKKQQGVAKKVKDNVMDSLEKGIDEKERRLDELKEHLKDIDVTTPKGKEEAISIINEISSLQAQQKAQQEQSENLDKNMKSGEVNYSDIKASETERIDDTEKMQETIEKIDPNNTSTDIMEQLVSQTVEDPDTPEQADEYLDNMQKIAEDAKKETEEKEEEKEEDDNEPTLWNRRKRPF